MTIDISANNPRISYSVAAGVTQTSFAVPFEFFDDSDLNVYIDTTLQTITTDYTVTGGAGSTGTVTITVTGPKTVIFTRDTTIERTTDFTAGVDINRAALNTQLDTLTAIAADNKDLGERSIRITDYDPAAANLLLPDAATRADKLLSFDTEGDIQVQAAGDLLTGSVLGANYTKASHTGDGTIVAFSTTEAAGSKNNIQVYIDGVYQNKDTFSISGSTLTFSEAPPLNSAIEFIVGNAVTSLTTDPDVVTYNQGGTGAQDRTLTSKLQETVSVKDFGAVGDGVTDDTDAIQAAIDSSSDVIRIPAGNYKITDKNGSYGILISATNKTIIGDGLEIANLIYTSSAINRPAISVTASDVHIRGIRIDGTANATKLAQTRANCNGITFTNASECSVRFCQIIGGHYGLHFDNDTGSYGNNDHNIAEGNILRNFQSTGFIAHKAQYLLLQGNDAKDCKNDGFKIAEGTRRSRVLGNTSRNNDRDGFDFYDGFIESVLDGNVAEGNNFFGYEVKGTSDGTDFVVRNSVFSNNVAEGNGVGGTYSGFSIISVINCSFDGNIAISNTGSGFDFNTVQSCNVVGCLSSRNTQHGFDLSTNVSRTQFTGCQAVDNSWVDGTTQNGTYHGYNLESSSTGQFVGCMALNGTTSGKTGGQGYGWYWPTAISGSRVQNCYTLNNVTGGFGGGVGWATSIGFFNNTDNGTLKGIEFTDDSLSKMTMTGSFNEMAIVDGVTAPATASGKAFIYVDSADGDLKVKFGDGTVKTIATDT